MAHRCHQCERDITPHDKWLTVEGWLRHEWWFCSYRCLFDWVKFFVGTLND